MPALLRGSFAGYSRWDGVNFGATVGVANMNTDFSQATANSSATCCGKARWKSETSVSGWNVLANDISNGQSFGAFLGYNMQWDEVVLGFDLAYHRFSSLETSDGPKSSTNRQHLGQYRARCDHFGAVVDEAHRLWDGPRARRLCLRPVSALCHDRRGGRAFQLFDLAYALTDLQTDADGNKSLYVPASQTDAKNDAYVAGFAVGLGLDVAVLPNVFLRARMGIRRLCPVNGIHT